MGDISKMTALSLPRRTATVIDSFEETLHMSPLCSSLGFYLTCSSLGKCLHWCWSQSLLPNKMYCICTWLHDMYYWLSFWIIKDGYLIFSQTSIFKATNSLVQRWPFLSSITTVNVCWTNKSIKRNVNSHIQLWLSLKVLPSRTPPSLVSPVAGIYETFNKYCEPLKLKCKDRSAYWRGYLAFGWWAVCALVCVNAGRRHGSTKVALG